MFLKDSHTTDKWVSTWWSVHKMCCLPPHTNSHSKFEHCMWSPTWSSIWGGGQHIVLGGFGIGLQRQRKIVFPPSSDVDTHLSVVTLTLQRPLLVCPWSSSRASRSNLTLTSLTSRIQALHQEPWSVDIGLVESPFQHTCLKHLQDCVVNGD